MSKRTKVIAGLLIIVLVIGGGVFGYFISSGKIKLHVSQAPVSNSTVRLTNTVTVNYNYSNDPGSFTKMSVKNLTANRGTNGYGALQAKRGDVLQYRVTLRSNINKLYNPFIYNGLEDPNNTNFKETMSFSTVSPGWGYSFSPSNAGSIPTYMTSSVGMAYTLHNII